MYLDVYAELARSSSFPITTHSEFKYLYLQSSNGTISTNRVYNVSASSPVTFARSDGNKRLYHV
jgi:hypothetical protein